MLPVEIDAKAPKDEPRASDVHVEEQPGNVARGELRIATTAAAQARRDAKT
jgi:hypothetical protein